MNLRDPADDRHELTDDDIAAAAESFCTFDFSNDICEMCTCIEDKDLLAWAKAMRAKFDSYLADIVLDRNESRNDEPESDGDE